MCGKWHLQGAFKSCGILPEFCFLQSLYFFSVLLFLAHACLVNVAFNTSKGLEKPQLSLN